MDQGLSNDSIFLVRDIQNDKVKERRWKGRGRRRVRLYKNLICWLAVQSPQHEHSVRKLGIVSKNIGELQHLIKEIKGKGLEERHKRLLVRQNMGRRERD